VRTPARILAVDDDPINLEILQARLASRGYEVLTAPDGEAALAAVRAQEPDLVLLDVMMPKLDGIEVCRRLRSDASLPFMPIILVTAKGDSADVVAGLEAGADEYLSKPVDHDALVARVRSMLRIKQLHDTVREQARRLEGQAVRLAEWNRGLEARVRQQVEELERLGRLRRFLSPQLAELIVAGGEESLLESHRREIVVVACDLHGFTAFAETAEPEEVMAVLRESHAALGELVFRFEGTLERFAGAGLTVLFNDPVPVPDAAARAARMVLAMRERASELSAAWRRRGHELSFRAGIAMGHATLGTIGFEGRLDYAAIGSVAEVAAGLCAGARQGQILAAQRVYAAVEEIVDASPADDLALPGFLRPVPACSILGLRGRRPPGQREASPLTEREQEVAALIAQGLTNRRIAEELVVTERTAASHVEHILNKLGFSSRTQIGVWAAERRRTASGSD
jgi:adenylate cyclase